jgi:hypothetical protein
MSKDGPVGHLTQGHAYIKFQSTRFDGNKKKPCPIDPEYVGVFDRYLLLNENWPNYNDFQKYAFLFKKYGEPNLIVSQEIHPMYYDITSDLETSDLQTSDLETSDLQTSDLTPTFPSITDPVLPSRTSRRDSILSGGRRKRKSRRSRRSRRKQRRF